MQMKSLQKISANAMQKHATDAGLRITIDPKFANTIHAHFPIFDPKEMVKVHAAPPFVYVKKPFVVAFQRLDNSTVNIKLWKPRKLKTIVRMYNERVPSYLQYQPGIVDLVWRRREFVNIRDLNTLIKADDRVSVVQTHFGAYGYKRKYQSITRNEHRRMERYLDDPRGRVPPFLHRHRPPQSLFG